MPNKELSFSLTDDYAIEALVGYGGNAGYD